MMITMLMMIVMMIIIKEMMMMIKVMMMMMILMKLMTIMDGDSSRCNQLNLFNHVFISLCSIID